MHCIVIWVGRALDMCTRSGNGASLSRRSGGVTKGEQVVARRLRSLGWRDDRRAAVTRCCLASMAMSSVGIPRGCMHSVIALDSNLRLRCDHAMIPKTGGCARVCLMRGCVREGVCEACAGPGGRAPAAGQRARHLLPATLPGTSRHPGARVRTTCCSRSSRCAAVKRPLLPSWKTAV